MCSSRFSILSVDAILHTNTKHGTTFKQSKQKIHYKTFTRHRWRTKEKFQLKSFMHITPEERTHNMTHKTGFFIEVNYIFKVNIRLHM